MIPEQIALNAVVDKYPENKVSEVYRLATSDTLTLIYVCMEGTTDVIASVTKTSVAIFKNTAIIPIL